MILFLFFFFFQAEDGIRDIGVTGVQTCALPICEMKVGELVDELGAPQPRVSDHLRCLAWCGYVQVRREGRNAFYAVADERVMQILELGEEDRKSTRLNSSHANISYAVFCLKKKKKGTID